MTAEYRESVVSDRQRKKMTLNGLQGSIRHPAMRQARPLTRILHRFVCSRRDPGPVPYGPRLTVVSRDA
jgi:hypothetical protein